MPNDILMTLQHSVAAVALMSLLPVPVGAATAANQGDAAARSWLATRFAAYDSGSAAAPANVTGTTANAPSAIALALATWDWLRRPAKTGAEPSLFTYANFLTQYPDWPQASTIQRQGESLAANPRTSDFEASRYFSQIPPETAAGKARYALLLDGRKAIDLARDAWRGTGLTSDQEAALLTRFGGSFSADDHSARADALLWAGQATAAERLLPLLDSDDRLLLSARAALIRGRPTADSLYQQALARFPGNAGLIFARAQWLERQGRLTEAEVLLGRGENDPATVSAPKTWLGKRLDLGRAALARKQYQSAWGLLANHRTYPAKTDTGALSLAERILLSDSEWLAGWIALRKLNRPDDAAQNFRNFLKAVNTPVSRSRGEYWLGRAEEARGNKKDANAAYERAARYFDYFYGQLATEKLGRTLTLPATGLASPSGSDRTRFQQSSLRQAVELLNGMASGPREALFIRALAASADTPGEAGLMATLGATLGRPDIGVWTWRNMRGTGDTSLFRYAYPAPPASALPGTRDQILIEGIIRQESSYDPRALSSAGARGLMQLMPGTAQDVSRRLGVAYSQDQLFSDPAYNIRLGGYYIGARRDGFRNAMLAIAAYNAGPGNVNRWLLANGDPRAGVDPIDWIELIPFSETRTYVQRVIENSVVYSLLAQQAGNAAPGAARTKASDWLTGP